MSRDISPSITPAINQPENALWETLISKRTDPSDVVGTFAP